MIESFNHVTKMQPLPPGRVRMRYLRLRKPVDVDLAGDEPAYQCAGCNAVLLAGVRKESVKGIAVKCPQCGTVSTL